MSNTFSSSSAAVSCGVPQDSMLGPSLFSSYMLSLQSLLRKFNISKHSYTDDPQLYFLLKWSEIQYTVHLQSLELS